jgi:hypothetical protein
MKIFRNFINTSIIRDPVVTTGKHDGESVLISF